MTVSSALDLWGFQEGRIWGLPGSGPPGELHLSWSISSVNAVMDYGRESRPASMIPHGMPGPGRTRHAV